MLKQLGAVLLMMSTAAGCAIDVDDDAEPTGVTMSELSNTPRLANNIPFRNPSGYGASYSTAGYIDLNNEFFQNLGTNGRRCVSCHLPGSGWGIRPSDMQAIFTATDGGVKDDGFGLGAVFRLNDGANSPKADVSTLAARRKAYSQLLTKGLIRVGIGIPANAEFELVAVDDPYGYASAAELSLFRRPLPSANLKMLSTVMWDGRHTVDGKSIHFNLSDQSNGATLGHAEGTVVLTEAQRDSIVNFEVALHTAQVWDDSAEALVSEGGEGGLPSLVAQEFYVGINDNFGDSRTGEAFTPIVFDIYDAWTTSASERRRSVARGQALFNTRTINITGVSGLNDEAAFGTPAVVVGTCTTCHNTPNGGNHSVVAPLNIGLGDASRRTADMPLYTLRNKATGELKQTVDPGRALISGRWKDIGRFKGPILRGLAARAPYFHDGSAADLGATVDFYNSRFTMRLTTSERADLVAFLRTL
ncbi:MAG: c-type cytochrome [Myxococcota bacterium]|nr:c-type cytochrome [Myxococcota bacterium]